MPPSSESVSTEMYVCRCAPAVGRWGSESEAVSVSMWMGWCGVVSPGVGWLLDILVDLGERESLELVKGWQVDLSRRMENR